MPASLGISAFGTALKIGDGATPENFATVAEVTNLGWSGMKVNTAKITNHSSPSAFEEYFAISMTFSIPLPFQ